MIKETGLKCVVSGSFDKHKSEIDRTIEEFKDLGVTVLAPETGWILKPIHRILTPENNLFRPLPTEQDMTIRQIEDSFLAALANSHFQYLENPDGYVGLAVALELGFGIAKGKQIFCRFAVSSLLHLPLIKVMSPSEVVNSLTLSN
jgi:hypothetical protein